MLRALCRSYRSAAASGFRTWNSTSSGRCGGELLRSCSSTSKDEGENDTTEQSNSSDTADCAAPIQQADADADVNDSPGDMVYADGSAEGGEAEGEGGTEPQDLDWDDVIDLWASAHACYIEKDRSILADAKRKADRDGTLKLYAADGSIESAYDDTSNPLYDSRVWLHMFEGPGGKLLPSYCKRTGAAQYMYDFTGFTEWRVEQNALLSDDAKCLMYKLWAPGRGSGAWSDEMLAHAFKIRVQRALAIVKIKELEFQAADQNVENLNKLQKLLGLDPQPSLKELHKPDCLYTTKHLTAWFDHWIQLYELLPHIIHPDCISALSDSSDDSEDADSAESDPADSASVVDSSEVEASSANGESSLEGASAEAADSASDSAAGEGEASGSSDSGKDKGKGKKGKHKRESGDGDKRVRLKRAQVNEVVSLHNKLTTAANGEAKQIACHDDLWRTLYHHGTGEKYIPFLQTMPAFEERPPEDAAGAVGDYDMAIEDNTRVQDRHEIEEFRRNLSWALQETGKSIQRAPRKRGARGATLPAKPEGGWPILVTPLHAGGKRGQPFVAKPDSTWRTLTADEELYLSHFKVEPRIFSRPRRHAPYTNDTLHMFTQRKPNPRHDLYNPPYEGSPKPKTIKSGPDRRDQRKARMAAMRKRKDLAPLLAGTRN